MASQPRCPWYGPTTQAQYLEQGHHDLATYLKENTMTAYHDRLTAGDYAPAKPKAEPKAESTTESAPSKPKRSTRKPKS